MLYIIGSCINIALFASARETNTQDNHMLVSYSRTAIIIGTA